MIVKQNSLDVAKSLVTGMCCAFLLMDAYEVVSGSADLTKHIPFLYPAVFIAFLLILRRIEKATARVSPEQYGVVQDRATLPSEPPPRRPPEAR
ncbi:hypothetical protein A3E39_04655 [Candidatus Uhrbacteria bacterium RIFCSPHIGHO2_12_FULL_60_25]|uniref:Uncharacterized protein n=1 Tax=Candidatus Uhrbacteria bacterium RIFCSPHIGHO2_12_FULL_60_25 TaxID=1802399 RepID=A0A1F7UJ71_9BACT|nr:MAG: hypothetical protein A3D73_04000 [Candidatus Uhrbacteria bacterium RIFCSPHIGHO2_02_FULL_60_44]OGL78326.1 MAG: hypothetical protein A3E39_04655 [Candidatus Uhrbacteria bacterium RIFCSPHIGHO2_12_FULL_60_25]